MMNRDVAKRDRPRLGRWIGFGLAALAGVGLGVVVWENARTHQPAQATETAGLPADFPTTAGVVDPDGSLSLLGTTASLSKTPLPLILVATAPRPNSAESTASLGTDARNPQVYGVGSMLANGAVITEIHADHVVLELDGRKATLHTGLTGSAAASNDKATTIGGPRPGRLQMRPATPESLTAAIRPEFVFEDDKVAGFRIFAGTNPAALWQLGLKEGDVVRMIDGRPVLNGEAWELVGTALAARKSVVLKVDRDGGLLTIVLDTSKLADTRSLSPPMS
jgi:hypothetical protein